MSDEELKQLAADAGLLVEWTDTRGETRVVSAQTQRAILAALGVECSSAASISDARARLAAERRSPSAWRMITASAGDTIELPFHVMDGARASIEFEQGGVQDLVVADGGRLPAQWREGYHRLHIGDRTLTLAVAPARCWTIDDIAPGERLWGLTAQVHGLRRDHDGGAGDLGAVSALIPAAARQRADAIGLSPTHALFAADNTQYSPYSPSSRLCHNILLADPADTFDAARLAEARERAAGQTEFRRLEALDLIEWPAVARAKKALLRALYGSFIDRELAKNSPLAMDFTAFRARGGEALREHAIFEALHARQYGVDRAKWNWRCWPATLRQRANPAVREFAQASEREVTFHMFAQWLVDRSLRRAQSNALGNGMRIGLIADLAVGLNAGGSQAWARPNDFLLGLSVGAPPDPLAPLGQDWGLTTFSPSTLRAEGYAPFIATLRAAMRHGGGLRIDHVMGVARLWLTPVGAEASDGAYLAYPIDDLLRLIALESRRHRAIVIGEDLGTVPPGLREKLARAGVYGMRILQFERQGAAFNPPTWYPANAVAMTSTHDTATVAGYWRGADLEIREALNHLPPGVDIAAAQAERQGARDALWGVFQDVGLVPGDTPRAEGLVIDASAAFLARTPAQLAMLPLEDALAQVEQPNLPGTIDAHPNWRRRYRGKANDCLDEESVAHRLRPLANRR